MDVALRLRSRAASSADAVEERRLIRALIAAMAALAVVLSLYQLGRPNMLFGVSEYDDAAYFGAAIRLVHGALPYRDFVLVQPPGSALLTSPLALLSHVVGTENAMAAARLFMPLVAGVNVILVGLLMRHRGQLATLIAAGLMAVFPSEVHATHTLLLEPLLDLFCLIGALLIFNAERFRPGMRSLLLGGVAFGFAGTIKGWALIPVVVVALLCLPHVRRRLAPFLGGVTLGFVLPTLPFAITAPGSFYREVVATQLSRIARSGRVPISTRLGDLTGSSSVTPNASLSLVVAIALLALLLVLIVAAAARLRRRPTTFEVFLVGSLLGVAALLMTPSEFYDHYAAFFAPFAAMTLGGAVGVVAARLPLRATLAVAAIGLIAVTLNETRIIDGEHGNNYAPSVTAVVPAGACALSDSAAYLITTDRFISTRAGCADSITDPYGTTISSGGSHAPATAAVWLHAIADIDYLVLSSESRTGRIPLVASIQAELATHFRLVHAGTLLIYVRNGFPVG